VNPDSLTWTFADRSILCDRPVLMGIVNVTPDSFSDGGKFFDTSTAVEHARQLVADGADILDIGGESTRPGSDSVSVDEEIRRVVPVIEALRDSGVQTPISIDTRKLKVAEKAVKAGAQIVNDVSALRNEPDLADFIAQNGLGVVLMHMLGMPKTMQQDPHYSNVIDDIRAFLMDRMAFATQHGIAPERIVLDPGIGFGKTVEHNLQILRDCGSRLDLGRPILIGPSRKAFIGKILGVEPDQRLAGTIAACVMSFISGARIFRVHDLRPVKEALSIAHAIRNASP
jgi:dihydropteroate synthase